MLLPLLLAAVLYPAPQPKDIGYRGIWYSNRPTSDEYRYKYAGGFATYPQQHLPIAIYSKEAEKTFFVYGGTAPGKNQLLHMVSYYDHKTGTVPRPTILLAKETDDAHDNPVLAIDDEGFLWVFSPSHGTARPSYIHRSSKPWSIDEFERVYTGNFSYPQPWFFPGSGFLFLHTRYSEGRKLFWMGSKDGVEWADAHPLAAIEIGHDQVSQPVGDRLGTAFNYHPKPVGLNARTNLYYIETLDHGRTWRNAPGEIVKLPLTEPDNASLVRDYAAEKRLVYLKDLTYDNDGHPVILYLTSGSFEPGPKGGERRFWTARWTGTRWDVRSLTATDHNYDFGSLYVEAGGRWRFIDTTEPGPQPYSTGGEIMMFVSFNHGQTWMKIRQVTAVSKRNHSYVRRPLHAHPDFYALWGDGNPLQPSESNLYFTNREGDHVWRLPVVMNSNKEKSEVVR